MPFILFLKSFEVLLFEIMSWLVFYPRTMWRSVRHPQQMMKRAENELALPAAEQFRDLVSPPIFLLLTVIAATGIEVAVFGHSTLIDNGIGLAAMITDNTSVILFRLITFALLPIIAGVCALAMLRRPVDRDTLQPLFYAQCFVTPPVVLASSIAETLTRLPQTAANPPAALLFAAAMTFYIGVEATWFVREAKRSIVVGLIWAIATFAISVVVVGATVLLFSGE
ncbi:MAG: hypothetical protein ABIO69_02770 [Sphingomicrobium sp.]